MSPLLGWISSALIMIGLAIITVAVIGLIRMPDTYMALHSAGKAVTLGIVSIALASISVGDVWITARSLLVAVFVVLTAPVSSHAIARAAYARREQAALTDVTEGPDPVSSSSTKHGTGE